MRKPSIPVKLHANEIRHDEGAFESTWTPGDTIGKFQEWTRFWVRQNAETTPIDEALSLAVHVRPCVKDTQSKFNPFKQRFGGETYDEMFAPIGKNQKEVDVLTTTPSNLDAVLVWTKEDGFELDQASVEQLFPENVKVERQGTAWVVYQKMLTTEEKRKRTIRSEREAEIAAEQHRERFSVPDLRTGERVINISPSGEIDETILHRGGIPLLMASETSKTHPNKRHDIARAVNAVDTNGPFIGFKKLFTAEQLKRLRSADAELVADCFSQFQRLYSGHQVEQLIPIISEGINTHIVPLIPKLTEGPIKNRIVHAVAMWKENLENPYRNFAYRQRNSEELHKTTGYLLQKNPQYFSVASMKNTNNTRSFASWSHEGLLLHASPGNNNSYTFMDAVGIIHELTHAQQIQEEIDDTNTLSPSEIQEIIKRFYNERPNNDEVLDSYDVNRGIADIDNECETFAVMSELFDARLDNGTYDHEDVMKELQLPATEDAHMQVTQLSHCATLYFQGGERVGSRYPKAFVDYIVSTYDGFARYTKDQNKNPILLEKAGENGLQHLYK